MMYDYTFIGCVKTKLAHPAKAGELYTSPLFRKGVTYAEPRTRGGVKNMYVLSAKYGLVPFEAEIAPYEKTLNRENKLHRKIWSRDVLLRMKTFGIPYNARILILAGRNYREYIMQKLPNAECPLEGLSLGNTLKFYNNGKD